MAAVQLADRVALITGGAHRVGKALTVALAGVGMRVAVHYLNAATGAEDLVSDLHSSGADAMAFRADLSRPEAPSQLISAVTEHFGSLNLLVNSAAVMRRTPVGDVSPEEWDAIFALNLRAPFFLCQAARPCLARSRGSIVNIADLAAFETWPAYVPHSISKAGLVQMTRALAHALAPDIRVNAVAPGAVLLPDGWDADAAQHLAATTPLRRLGSPTDVADAVLYLARSDYVTGETIIVDGGRHVRT
ncbi:MAG: SDR family oxidoreductase [Gemmatimonadaceae bacterium]